MAGSSEDPYRSPSQLPEPLVKAPADLVYLAGAHERRNGALRKMAGWLWLGATVCLAVLVLVPQVGTWLLAGLVAFVTFRWLQNRKPERIVLAVRDGCVVITLPAGEERFELARLRQVELDTRSIAKAYADKVVGTAVVSLGVMPAIDVSRIVLVVDGEGRADPGDATRRADPGDAEGRAARRIVLGSDYDPSSEVTLWLGKLRVFLRKNGWIPFDERDA